MQAGNYTAARDIAFRHTPLIRFVAGQAYVAGTKALLTAMGLPVGDPRPPRLPLNEAGQTRARQIAEQLNLRVPLTSDA